MKYRILRWLGCGILVLMLTIGTGACASVPEKGASETFKVDLPAKSDTAQQEQITSRTEQAETMDYDDSLITDAYADSGKEKTSWDYVYGYDVHIPALRCDSADARR